MPAGKFARGFTRISTPAPNSPDGTSYRESDPCLYSSGGTNMYSKKVRGIERSTFLRPRRCARARVARRQGRRPRRGSVGGGEGAMTAPKGDRRVTPKAHAKDAARVSGGADCQAVSSPAQTRVESISRTPANAGVIALASRTSGTVSRHISRFDPGVQPAPDAGSWYVSMHGAPTNGATRRLLQPG